QPGLVGQIYLHLFRADLIQFAVALRGDDGLGVIVDADDLTRPQQGGRDSQDAGTTAIVDYRATLQFLLVQPLQAKRGGRMRAGAEGEAWVKHDVDGRRFRRSLPTGADPHPRAE